MNAIDPPTKAELEATLDWWRLAGVSHDFAEDATDWLGADEVSPSDVQPVERRQVEAEPTETPEPERIDLLGENAPADLDSFHRFWLEAPGLDTIGPRGRVSPRGPANAALMVLVIDPEEGDGDHLLSGPQGNLLERILSAMGLGEDQVYFASALPRPTPMADTAALAAGGMDAVTLRHIDLASPKRVVAFGSNIPPLLGHALTKELSDLREINQTSRSIPLLVSEGLDSMIAMPRLKARFWRRWIEWSAD